MAIISVAVARKPAAGSPPGPGGKVPAPMPPKLPTDLPAMVELGFDGLYGLELLELTDQLVRGRVAVRDDLKQPAGLVHGGVHAAIAESLASVGTAFAGL